MKTATQSVIDRLWEASIPVSFGGIVPDRYVWLDDAVCVVRDAVDALVERAEKAEAALADLKMHHAEVVHDLRGKLEVEKACAVSWRATLESFAERDCDYGDGCPATGTRHGRCVGCLAREALAEPEEVNP